MEYSKSYYSIAEVETLLSIPKSTLYHWEKEKVGPKPLRNANGERKYTPKDIEKLKQVMMLKEVKGLKLDGVKKTMHFKNQYEDGIENTKTTLLKLRNFFVALRDEL
jgi:DNA-binding transcriptional MerR regulator